MMEVMRKVIIERKKLTSNREKERWHSKKAKRDGKFSYQLTNKSS